MQIISTSKRIDIAKKPLQIQQSLSTVGTVPTSQTYDSVTGIYSPDYTIAPLVLQPIIGIIDKDEILESGRVNADLAFIEWSMIKDGHETVITPGGTGYESFRITPIGDENAGCLEISMNAAPHSPITFRFKGIYLDGRTGQQYHIELSQLVQCDSSRLEFELILGMPQGAIYNPLRSEAVRNVTAELRLGMAQADPARTAFVWEKADGGVWRAIDPAEPMDYDAVVSADGTALEVHQDLMGDRLDIRCTAYYDNTDTATPDPLNNGDEVGRQTAAIVRRIPQLDCDYGYFPTIINRDEETMTPKAIVSDSAGDLDLAPGSQANSALSISWRIAKNKSAVNETLTYSTVGTGPAPTLPTTALAVDYGAVLEMVVEDRGPLGAWVDSDGAILTDSDGAILLI